MIVPPSRSRIRAFRAFTLVEMLTAMAVLAIIGLVLANLNGEAAKVWSFGEKQNQFRQRARAALDIMSRDLRAATLPVNPAETSLQFIINPPSVGDVYMNRDTVFWQAPVASNRDHGNLAEVGYFVRWSGTSANLCRFFVNPAAPAAAPATNNYLIYSKPDEWITGGMLDLVAPADKSSNFLGLFLPNVIGLWVKGHKADGTAYEGDSRIAGNLPAYVDVSLVFLDTATALRVADPSVVRSLYGTSATAADLVTQLPPQLKQGANVVSIRVNLTNSQGIP